MGLRQRYWIAAFAVVIACEVLVSSCARAPQPETYGPPTFLKGGFPNPFSLGAFVPVTLDQPRQVELVVYDTVGNFVDSVPTRVLGVGDHRVWWDGFYQDGSRAKLGTTFMYRLTIDTAVTTGEFVFPSELTNLTF